MDTGTLLTELLVTSVLLGVVEGDRLDDIADDDVEKVLAALLKVDEVDTESAKAGAAIASPQARTAMELWRRVCMVNGELLQCNEGTTSD